MKRQTSDKDSLDATFERANRIDPSELELRADFARHLCVLVSGFLDQSIKRFTTEYVEKRASPTVARYVNQSITNLTNLKSSKLVNHLCSIDESWKSALDILVAEERKDAIDSLVTLRHGIAHGKPGDVTLARVANYYKEIIKVIDGIRDLMRKET
ncbi:MAE_28990/MAE_18760 family HEPN-like nuclease [Xanthomonas cannabis]|uniref:HEPN domain-containing protein n=1 Tax=Xanthomonas cannabis TaxID=1885674 RepID=UPI0033AE4ABC